MASILFPGELCVREIKAERDTERERERHTERERERERERESKKKNLTFPNNNFSRANFCAFCTGLLKI